MVNGAASKEKKENGEETRGEETRGEETSGEGAVTELGCYR